MNTFFNTAYSFFVYVVFISFGVLLATTVFAVGANPFEQEVELNTPQLELDSQIEQIELGEEGTVDSGVASLESERPDFVIDTNSRIGDGGAVVRVLNHGRPFVGEIEIAFVWTGENDDEYVTDICRATINNFTNGIGWVACSVDQPINVGGYLMIVDPANKIQEVNETNNRFFNLLERSQVNVDLSFDEETSLIGNSAQEISLDIDGDLHDDEELYVSFYWEKENGESIGNFFGERAIKMQDGWKVWFNEEKPEDAVRYIVRVDVQGQIDETNEDNNVSTIELEDHSGFFNALFGFLRENNEEIESQIQLPSDVTLEYLEGSQLVDEYKRKLNLEITDAKVDNFSNTLSLKVENKNEFFENSRYVPHSIGCTVGTFMYSGHQLVNLNFQEVLLDNFMTMPGTSNGFVWESGAIDINQFAQEVGYNDGHGFDIECNTFYAENNYILAPEEVDLNLNDNSTSILYAPDFQLNSFDFDIETGIVGMAYQNNNPQGHGDVPVTLSIAYWDREEGSLEESRERSVFSTVISGIPKDSDNIQEKVYSNIITVPRNNLNYLENIAFMSLSINRDSDKYISEYDSSNNTIIHRFDPTNMVMLEELEEVAPSTCEAGLVPGDTFYFADKVVEGIKNVFTFGDENEVERLSDVACERHAELVVLMKEGDKERVAENVEELAEVIEERSEALEELTEGKNENVEELSHRALLDNTVYYVFLERVSEEVEEAEVVEILNEVSENLSELRLDLEDSLSEEQLEQELLVAGLGGDSARRVIGIMGNTPIAMSVSNNTVTPGFALNIGLYDNVSVRTNINYGDTVELPVDWSIKLRRCNNLGICSYSAPVIGTYSVSDLVRSSNGFYVLNAPVTTGNYQLLLKNEFDSTISNIEFNVSSNPFMVIEDRVVAPGQIVNISLYDSAGNPWNIVDWGREENGYILEVFSNINLSNTYAAAEFTALGVAPNVNIQNNGNGTYSFIASENSGEYYVGFDYGIVPYVGMSRVIDSDSFDVVPGMNIPEEPLTNELPPVLEPGDVEEGITCDEGEVCEDVEEEEVEESTEDETDVVEEPEVDNTPVYHCKESLICFKNKGNEESYGEGEAPEGAEFVHCGQCEYIEEIAESEVKKDETIGYKCTKPVSCFMNGSSFESYAIENAPAGATLMYCGECNVPKVEEKDPAIVAPAAPDADAHFVIYHNKIEPRTLTAGPSMALKIYNYTSQPQKLEGDIHSSEIPPYSSIRIGAPVAPGNYSFYLTSNGAVAGTIAIPDPTPTIEPEVDNTPVYHCKESLICFKNKGNEESYGEGEAPEGAEFVHCGQCEYIEEIAESEVKKDETIGYKCTKPVSCFMNGSSFESYAIENAPAGATLMYCGECNVPKVEEKDPAIVAPAAPDADAHFVIYHNKIEPRTLTAGPSMALKIYNYTSQPQKLEGDIHSSEIPPYSSIRIGAPVAPGNYSFYLTSNGAVAGTIAIPDPTPTITHTAPEEGTETGPGPFGCVMQTIACFDNQGTFEDHYTDDYPNSASFEHCGECTSSELYPVESTPDPVVPAIPGDECTTDYICLKNLEYGSEETYEKGTAMDGYEYLKCGSCFGY